MNIDNNEKQNTVTTNTSRKRTIIYSEPAEYFPEEIRKEFKLGEYAETEDDE